MELKKLTSMVSVLILALLLTACGGSEETKSFELNNGAVIVKITYTYKGDKVTKQSTMNTIPYADVGLTSKEEAQELFDPLIEPFQGINGLTHKMEYKDSEAIETLSVEYKEADIDEIKKLPGMMIDGDTSKGISMKESATLLESQGFKEVK